MHDGNPIPDPEPVEPHLENRADRGLLVAGAVQQKELTEPVPQKYRHINWALHFIMKPALFLFVLWLNFWWDLNVIHVVWQTGRVGTGFHLSDSVVIALITTSIANFLVLIHIVAKHLFPEKKG